MYKVYVSCLRLVALLRKLFIIYSGVTPYPLDSHCKSITVCIFTNLGMSYNFQHVTDSVSTAELEL